MSPRPLGCRGCGERFEAKDRRQGKRFCDRCQARLEPVAIDRTASSPAILAARVSGLAVAWRAGDEASWRDELRQLAAEAALLGRTYPLFQTAVDQRQRIAAESEGPGRIA
jgi:hypothetical protein